METAIIAVIAFVPMLVMLVVIHEWGHFFTARAFGVKVLEFGIGYPPRAFGLYTGRTRVLLDAGTQYVNLSGPDAIQRGLLVRVHSTEDADGNLVARIVEGAQSGSLRRSVSLQDMDTDELLRHEGTVREADFDSLVVADMIYTVNWLPLGGFVRLAGENNPAVPRSLASKGPGPRTIILAAGSLMNALFPLVAFAVLFMIPQSVTVGQVQVDVVEPNSPAQAAGILPGDLVLAAGDRTIEQGSDLVRATTLNAGTPMEWTIQRDGLTEIVQLTPRANPPPGQGADGHPDKPGEPEFRDPLRPAVDRRVEGRDKFLGDDGPAPAGDIVVDNGDPGATAFRPGGNSPGNRRGDQGRGSSRMGGAVHPVQHQPGHPEPATHTHAGRRADSVRAAGVGTGRPARSRRTGRPGTPDRLRRAAGLYPVYHLQRHRPHDPGRQPAGWVSSSYPRNPGITRSLNNLNDLAVFSADTRPRLVSMRLRMPASRIWASCSATLPGLPTIPSPASGSGTGA